MAKFGIALGSGPRGLGFESRHSDQNKRAASAALLFLAGMRDSKGRHQSADWCNQVSGGHLISLWENPLLHRRTPCVWIWCNLVRLPKPYNDTLAKTPGRICGQVFFVLIFYLRAIKKEQKKHILLLLFLVSILWCALTGIFFSANGSKGSSRKEVL